jgi:hypothetical protein
MYTQLSAAFAWMKSRRVVAPPAPPVSPWPLAVVVVLEESPSVCNEAPSCSGVVDVVITCAI